MSDYSSGRARDFPGESYVLASRFICCHSFIAYLAGSQVNVGMLLEVSADLFVIGDGKLKGPGISQSLPDFPTSPHLAANLDPDIERAVPQASAYTRAPDFVIELFPFQRHTPDREREALRRLR